MPIHPIENIHTYKNPVTIRAEEMRQRAKNRKNPINETNPKKENHCIEEDISSTFDIKKQRYCKNTVNLLILNMKQIVP